MGHEKNTISRVFLIVFPRPDIKYLQETLPSNVEPEFFDYLRNLTPKDVTIHALTEGTIAFPRVPLIRIEGPLIVAQLLETTFLTLVNFARSYTPTYQQHLCTC